MLEKEPDMRERLHIRVVDEWRPVVNAKANKWRRKARRTWLDMRDNSRYLGVEDWFWLALLVIWGLASGYATFVASGQGQGLW
jgi:hypothetical protein